MKIKVEALIKHIKDTIENQEKELKQATAKKRIEEIKHQKLAFRNAQKLINMINNKASTPTEITKFMDRSTGLVPYASGREWEGRRIKEKKEKALKDIRLLGLSADETINVGVNSNFNRYL